MNFDELFILPNEAMPQSGGHESFVFLKYIGSDTLTKRPEIPLTKPLILTKKETPTTNLDSLEGYEAAAGITEDDVMAVSGDAFLQILENQQMGGNLTKHLFFNPNNAATIPINNIVGEQVLFLTIFHELYFLASINKLGLPTLNAPINERFDALRDLLKKEQLSNMVFGISHKSISDYFLEIQKEYVGTSDIRTKSFIDMCEMIMGEPTDIIKYFYDGLARAKELATNSLSAYTGTSTRRGFNSISLATHYGNDDENEGATGATGATGPVAEDATGATGATGPVAEDATGATGPVAEDATGATGATGPVAEDATGATGPLAEDATGATGPSAVEGKESEDAVQDVAARTVAAEGKEDEENNAASRASENPHSVTVSADREGKEDENTVIGLPPVNARITAHVPPAVDVRPPALPPYNRTRNVRRARREALEKKKQQNEAKAATKKRKTVKKPKRSNTLDTTAAVYDYNLPAEEVSNNNEGYNTTKAVVPPRVKKVGFHRESTAMNKSGIQSLVATGK